MATKKKLLQAAAGSAGGGGGLNVEEVFSTYLYEGNGGSQAIQNDINLGQSYGSGSTYLSYGNYLEVASSSDFAYGTGDFTVEGFLFAEQPYCDSFHRVSSNDLNIYLSGGVMRVYLGGSHSELTGTISVNTNEWVHVAVSRQSGTMRLFVNGTLDVSTTSTPSYSAHTVFVGKNTNFFEGYVSNLRIVSGTALYTSSFTAPTSALTAVSGTVLLACQTDNPFGDNSSSAHSITNNGAVAEPVFGPFDAADAGEGGLVWGKNRSQAFSHNLYDTERGTGVKLLTNGADGNASEPTGLTSFNSNGFTLGSGNDLNNSGDNYASWTFRKAPKFFDCIKYTGTSADQTINHNLGTTVGAIFIKSLDSSRYWWCTHRGLNGGTNWWQYDIHLNDSLAEGTEAFYAFMSEPSSTSFTLRGGKSEVNANGENYVAYLFAHNDGDGEFGPDGDADIIKCGSYSGSSSAAIDIDLGFEPQWLLVKRTNGSNSPAWWIADVMRGWDSSGISRLEAQSSAAEQNPYGNITPTATGFHIPQGNVMNDNSSSTYIYIAIRRGPMAVPTDATDVFALEYEQGSGTSFNPVPSGFPVDAFLSRAADDSDNWVLYNRQTGDNAYLYTNATDAEQSTYQIGLDYNDQVAVGIPTGNIWNGTSFTYARYMWRRAPSFCDVVAYTGNGTAGRTVSHNLGVAPEMMWVKNRAGEDWMVYSKSIPANEQLHLNTTAASTSYGGSGAFNNTAPTSEVFSLNGSGWSVNNSNTDYIAYLFASVDGVSKVGSYTGTGSAQTIDCGFSSGARFVLIKRSDSTGDWRVFDTERGIVVGNDLFLELNTTDAENNSFDMIRPDSSGFIAYNISVNGSGGTYIFYAIA